MNYVGKIKSERLQGGFGNPKGIAIIQPSVARNELRWVIVPNQSSTLKGLNQQPKRDFMKLNLLNGIGGIDATLSGLKNCWWITQRSRWRGNAGLNDLIPLGLKTV